MRAAELFAGVGGFRLGLERAGIDVVWSNQWEPSTRMQHASDIYVARFGGAGHHNGDIAAYLDEVEAGRATFPRIDLVVGGFPCQSYSVAQTLSRAAGIEGAKGVLWWEIHRLLRLRKPRYVFLENVDRLLKSPAGRRGRDFAIILASLSDLGYTVEWRVVNAADYGGVQRRRRVFIVGSRGRATRGIEAIFRTGVLARALPVRVAQRDEPQGPDLEIAGDLAEIFEDPRWSGGSPFSEAGVLSGRRVWTRRVEPTFRGRARALGHVLVPDADVPASFVIPREQVAAWRYLKGAKREPRAASNGHAYLYTEGAVAFPDPLDKPSRTILTGEGGSTPSRFKHVVETADGRLRRLLPLELERLNGFPDGWTEHPGVRDGRRAFLMGNALVVPIVERIARAIAADAAGAAVARAPRAARASVRRAAS